MRIRLLSAEAAKYLPFAKQKLRLLRDLRESAGVASMQRYISVESFLIFLRTTEAYDEIRISGGEIPQMLFAAAEKSTPYRWSSDKLLPSFNFSGNLHPFVDGEVHGNGFARFKTGWRTGDLVEGVILGVIPAYEMEFTLSDLVVTAHTKDATWQAAAFSGFTSLPDLSGPYLSLMGIAAYEPQPWNLYAGATGFTVNPATGSGAESWRWVPSFFVAEPANGYGITPGWHYGEYPNSDYGIEKSLESLNVSLCAVLETRDTQNTQTGWCETVTAVNGQPSGEINFFFGLSVPGHSTAYREVAMGTHAHALLTIGTALTGFKRAFQVTASVLEQKPNVDFWSFRSWGADAEEDACGAIVVEGTRCRGFRYAGYLSQFIDISSYHSHVVSQNGRLVAIFEGESVIERVRIFDLYGERVDVQKAVYAGGGFTELRDSTKVHAVNALSGCFIPFRDKGFSRKIPAQNTTTLSSGYAEYMPSLSTLVFYKDGIGPLEISKVVCDNGVDAYFGVSEDECFESVIYIDEPSVSNDDRLVSTWGVGGVIRGKVRGSFTGAHPNMRFAGETIDLFQKVTLPKTLNIYRGTSGGFLIEGMVGTPTYGGCFNADGTENEDCCEGRFTVTTSCGQHGELYEGSTCCPGEELLGLVESGGSVCLTGGVPSYYQWDDTNNVWVGIGACDIPTDPVNCPVTYTYNDSCGIIDNTDGSGLDYSPPVNPSDTLNLSGAETPSVGSIYSASGGVAPYTYSISCGSIDPDTGEVTDLSGCCGSGTATVTDDCGATASMTVRFPSGVWVLVSDQYADWASNCTCKPVTTCTFYVGMCLTISGKYKYGAEYRDANTRLWCVQNEPVSQCSAPAACSGVDCYVVNARTYEWQCP